MSDDVDQDAGDTGRPAPTRDRLISWGRPPDDDDPEVEEEPAPSAAPDAPLVTAQASPPPTVPAVPRPVAPPPPSSRAPGTFEPLAPPVIRGELASDPDDEAPPRRTWTTPSITAPAAAERRTPEPPRPTPRATPPEPRPERAERAERPATAAPTARPVSITELSHQLTEIQRQLTEVARRPKEREPVAPAPAPTPAPTPASPVEGEGRPSARTDAALRHLSKQLTTVQAQLTGLGEHLGRSSDAAGDKRATERTNGAITELSQQLAATQAQVASLSAQLTTLAHRVTYDLERGAQTTTERLVRDLPAVVSPALAAELGPALDDLTDQVEADRAKLTSEVEALNARVSALAEAVEGLPLANVELMTSIQSLEHDIEDRLARLANRLTDQVATLERSNGAELVRVRDHVADLHDLMASPLADAETLDRMAGQVERLSQRAGGSGEVVDALELLIAEHLEVLRDDIEGRVGALAPMLQEELEAVRAEAVAGVGAAEEALTERIDALEEVLVARIDTALAEQVDGRLEELATATAGVEAGLTEQLAGVTAALGDLQEAQADAAHAEPDRSEDGEVVEALAAITEELQSLRRRITLRLENGDAPTGLTDTQLEDLATRVAAKLRGATTDDAPAAPAPPAPRHAARSETAAPRIAPRSRPSRAAKRA